jgi:hypothetical protein
MEATPKLAFAHLFADISCDTPLTGYLNLSLLRSDSPGLSPDKPMAVVQGPLLVDGAYVIKNQAFTTLYLGTSGSPQQELHFYPILGNGCPQVKYCSLVLEVLKG